MFAEFRAFAAEGNNQSVPLPLRTISIWDSVNADDSTVGTYRPTGRETVDGDSTTCYEGITLDVNNASFVYEINASVTPIIKSFDILLTKVCPNVFMAQVELGRAENGPWVISQPWTEVHHPGTFAQMRTVFANEAAWSANPNQKRVRNATWSPLSAPLCKCATLSSVPAPLARTRP